MLGINMDNIFHELRVDPIVSLIAQKWRSLQSWSLDNNGKLMEVRYIKDFCFQIWIVKPILVQKYNKWRMCIGNRKLNKTCPTDSYPLPPIDYIVNTTNVFVASWVPTMVMNRS